MIFPKFQFFKFIFRNSNFPKFHFLKFNFENNFPKIPIFQNFIFFKKNLIFQNSILKIIFPKFQFLNLIFTKLQFSKISFFFKFNCLKFYFQNNFPKILIFKFNFSKFQFSKISFFKKI